MMINNNISVIIPTYNSESTIFRSISSLYEQTVLPSEIIIIDDCSTDSTESICNTFLNKSGPKVTYFKLNENKGPSMARNIGVSLATSNFISFLDSDDIFYPDKIETILNVLNKNPSIKIIAHNFNYIKNGIPFCNSITLNKISNIELLIHNPVITPSLVISKSCPIKFSEDLRYCEDYDLLLNIGFKYGIWKLEGIYTGLGRQPMSPGGLSNSLWQMRKGEIVAYKNFLIRKKLFLILPIFILFSLFKHLYTLFKKLL